MRNIRFDDDTIQEVFGHEAAEDDNIERLKKYYFKNTAYERLNTGTSLRILIGHKGIGKSAMLAVAAQEDATYNRLAIMLRPDDIDELPLDSDELIPLIKAWKLGLLRLIRAKVLEFFSLGCQDIHEDAAATWSALARDLARNISSWINTAHVSLEETKAVVLKNFAADNEIRIYVDDLDRGWTASPLSVKRMSAMLNAMRDITRDYKNIRFVVSLRSDVYYLVRTSDESTDKLESACIWFSWTNHEILAMLMKRIKTFFGLFCPRDQDLVGQEQPVLAQDLTRVMEGRFSGKGKWNSIPTYRMLMTLIRRRPRDLVKLCTLAARHAHERSDTRILTEDFDAVFSRYSQDRMQDAINEFKSELPNIQDLLVNMKPSKRARKGTRTSDGGLYVFTSAELIDKLKNIRQNHNFKFYGKTSLASERELLGFLYKIGFITALKTLPSGKKVRHFFEDQNYVASLGSDYGYSWEIHPAYRWALSPAEPDVLTSIELLDDAVTR